MTSQNKIQYIKMTETPVKRLILTLAVPTIVSMLVSAIYNTADTYFVSQINTSASGAVGVVFSVMAIMQAVGFLFGMGAGSNISRLLGQQDSEQANRVAASSVVSSFCLGVLITILGLVFIEPLMNILGATETILPYATDYAKFIFMGAPFIITSFVLNNILRAQGNAVLSMVGLSVGGLLNIVLDPLFIFAFDMGIAGSAIATIISQIISFVILISLFIKGKSMISLNFKYISRTFSTYWLVIKAGMPSFARQGLASFATIFLNTSARVYGDSAVSAMAIVGKIGFLIIAVLLGFGQGFQPVVGFAYGAKKYKRVREAFRFSLVVGTAFSIVLSVICFIFATEIVSQFRKDDFDVIKIGALALWIQCFTVPLQPITVLCNMLLQTVGKSVEATFVSSSRQGLFFIPLIVVLPRFVGLLGVQISQPIADLLSAIVCIYFLFRFFRTLPKKDM
ncbi:MAG: MATE family efflux transporter [Oscillospiraceae bacterium]|nr:MATE family efflux transporter [Oscillospiraceae bacterium]